MIDAATVEQAFCAAIADAGLYAPADIIGDGEVHAFKSGEMDKDLAGWYVLHVDDAPAGKFGCMRRLPDGIGWHYGTDDALTEEEREQLRADQAARKAATAKRTATAHEEKAKSAARRWAKARIIESDDDPYLQNKGVQSHGLRRDSGGLLVPLSDGEGKLWAIQTINAGALVPKKVVGRQSGNFYRFGPDPADCGEEWIGEGYATVATVLEALGGRVSVCMAVNGGNLRAVALARLELYPQVHFHLAADNDRYTPPDGKRPGNPGATWGYEAVEALHAAGGVATLHWPDFDPAAPRKANDFNDLRLFAGDEEVRKQLAIDRAGQDVPQCWQAEPADSPGVADHAPPPQWGEMVKPPWETAKTPWGAANRGIDVPVDPDTGMPWPRIELPWSFTGGALVHTKKVKDDYEDTVIGNTPLWLHAMTEGEDGSPGLALRYFDRLWRFRQWVIPASLLHATEQVLGHEISEQGYRITPGQAKMVARYLANCEGRCERVIEARSRLGWHETRHGEHVFILPGRILSENSVQSEVVYHAREVATKHVDSLQQSGTLDEWKNHVAAKCTDNPLLQFGVLCGLAGALLHLVGEGCGGFHFYGSSSRGKTTLCQAAASVWGSGADPSREPAGTSVRRWSSTITALEGMAELHSHQLLTLDEIGQSDIGDPGRAVYKLASGVGKERGTPTGGLQPARSWLLLFLSNGEISLRQLMGRKGADFFTGQRVRLVDIPATDAVVDTHGQDAVAFVDQLKHDCAQYFGSAGPAFVVHLLARLGEAGSLKILREQLRRELETAGSEVMYVACESIGIPPEQLPGEVRRALSRFALVCLAGLMAAPDYPGGAGVIPWGTLDVYRVVGDVASRWIREIGQERSDIDRALRHVRSELLTHGSRIQPAQDYEETDGADDSGHKRRPPQDVRDRLGWRYRDPAGGWWYLFIPSGWDEICGQYDSRAVARRMIEDGFMRQGTEADRGEYFAKAPRGLPGLAPSRPRLVWVSSRFVDDGAGDDPDEEVSPEF